MLCGTNSRNVFNLLSILTYNGIVIGIYVGSRPVTNLRFPNTRLTSLLVSYSKFLLIIGIGSSNTFNKVGGNIIRSTYGIVSRPISGLSISTGNFNNSSIGYRLTVTNYRV